MGSIRVKHGWAERKGNSDGAVINPCPTLIAVGLIDETARAAGVLAAYNAIQAPKELIIMPLQHHHGDGGAQNVYQQRFDEWKAALAVGKPAPIPAPTPAPDPAANGSASR